jgi:hypothetical protein
LLETQGFAWFIAERKNRRKYSEIIAEEKLAGSSHQLFLEMNYISNDATEYLRTSVAGYIFSPGTE